MATELQPLLSRDRYTDEDWALSSAGLCDDDQEARDYPAYGK